jgi:hypothetical protein
MYITSNNWMDIYSQISPHEYPAICMFKFQHCTKTTTMVLAAKQKYLHLMWTPSSCLLAYSSTSRKITIQYKTWCLTLIINLSRVYCIIYLHDDQDSDGVDVSVSCLCKLSLWSTVSIHPAKRTETHEEHITANAMKEKGSRGEDKNK